LALKDQGVGFSDFLWQFVDHQPRQNHWQSFTQVPVTTPESDAMSRALKKAGFNFVGPTIVYAFMQATGMVNDHLVTCPAHQEWLKLAHCSSWRDPTYFLSGHNGRSLIVRIPLDQLEQLEQPDIDLLEILSLEGQQYMARLHAWDGMKVLSEIGRAHV